MRSMKPSTLLVLSLAAMLVAAGRSPGDAEAKTEGTAAPPALSWRLERADLVDGWQPEVLGAPRPWPQGAGGPALWFDGERDGLVLPVNPIAGLGRFTIEVLIRPENGGPEAQRFLHAAGAGEDRAMIELRMIDDRTWCLDTYLRSGTNGLTLIDRAKTHPAGVWTWVALVYDGQTMSAWVDGVRETSGPLRLAPIGAGKTSIGVRQSRTYWFKGAIAEVRISAEALPPAKLQRAEGHPAGAE